MTTHMPALALLVISLALVGLSIYTAWDTAATPIEIKGAAAAVDEEVKVLFKSQWPVPVAGRQASQVLRPRLDAIMLVINAPRLPALLPVLFQAGYRQIDRFPNGSAGTTSPELKQGPKTSPRYRRGNPAPLSSSGGLGGREGGR